jgi:hypothetical protein
MATTAAITISSDIGMGASVSKSMTLTKAGALTDIEETTGFSRRKLAATTAVDLITMANELVEPSDNTAAKVYIQNIGDGKGNVDKSTYVTVSIGDTGGTTQQVGRLYGGDWLMMPATVVDDMDIVVAPSTNDAVVLEYTMFYE